MEKTFYHTQESREKRLDAPIYCKRDDAWLGEATYFWYELFDAERWGKTSKKGTGFYEIYKCNIICDDILDTVFNEEHYYFWLEQIEKVASLIIQKTGLKPMLKELNDYFFDKGIWDDVDGIQFQDLPLNPKYLKVKISDKKVFAYRKRIQIAVYNQEIISNFEYLKREAC